MPPSARNGQTPAPSRVRLASELEALAAAIEAHKSDAVIRVLLETLRQVCDQLMAQRSADPSSVEWVGNVRTVLQTWSDVWPRMGQRKEFRAAVAREARLWLKRLPV